MIKKKKHAHFLSQFGEDGANGNSINRANQIIELANLSMHCGIEGHDLAKQLVRTIVSSKEECEALTLFLKEVTGDDYHRWLNESWQLPEFDESLA